jgi:diketogulonate reductase-like aldo/keto reductase
VQNRFYAETGYDVGIRGFCNANGIMYQSFWTLTGNPSVLRSSIIRGIAERIGMSAEGVFYRFCVEEGVTVLDGTTSEEHMVEDLRAVTDDAFTLNEDEKREIRTLLR